MMWQGSEVKRVMAEQCVPNDDTNAPRARRLAGSHLLGCGAPESSYGFRTSSRDGLAPYNCNPLRHLEVTRSVGWVRADRGH